jgi:hypothetical protein
MQNFLDATRTAVGTNNWHAALALALTMPDICGRLENPQLRSEARFTDWFDRFLLKRYQAQLGPDRRLHTFLCAADCYALRCAYLHQGEFGIDDQRAQQALDSFRFTMPPQGGGMAHMNQYRGALQLQIDIFCEHVCSAVEEWRAAVRGDANVQARIARLAEFTALNRT